MINYIRKHWRGEFSLPHAYWVNGVLFGLPLNIYFRTIDAIVKYDQSFSPLWALEWIMLPIVMSIPFFIWQIVGIWRSAGRSITEGRKFWAWIARIIMILNLLVILVFLVMLFVFGVALVNGALKDSNSAFAVHAKGNIVEFSGTITFESTKAALPLLERKNTTRLIIDSNGGFVGPALKLAQAVKAKKLEVVAVGQCASGCAMVLAAGADRFTTPTTLIGLHSSSVDGFENADIIPDQSAQEDEFYRGAGLSPEFIAKFRKYRGKTSLYYPTMREAIVQGLVTGVLDRDRRLFVSGMDWCSAHLEECDRTGLQNYEIAKSKKH
ncbi:MAG: ATP-dependent Clp protease proteolytic subunit [Proteobacteria bacterium]|nr:ATP-dependent Clp protease proteolytic subunit [Pseudomonadota bacterium]